MFLFSFIKSFIFAGVSGSFKTSQNRGVLATNIINIWGLISVFLLSSFLRSNNIDIKIYGPGFCFILIACCMAIFLNYKRHYGPAKLFTFITINIVAWNAAILFGKSFNGYYYFFVSIVYLFLLMSKVPKAIKYTCYLIVFATMPLVDYLSFNELIPITSFHSSQFSASLIIADTVFVNIIIATLIFVEKTFFDKQEGTLLVMNNDLEKLVEKRTALLLKSKLDNLKADQIKTQFLSNISHEVRTPVQGIIGFTDMATKSISKAMDEGADIRKVSIYVHNIKKASARLLNLLEKLFLITREGSDVFKPTAQEFEFNSVLDEVIDDLDLTTNNLSLKFLETIKAPLMCKTDVTFLRQSLKCLLENASNYSDQGSEIKVRVSSKENSVVVAIENQGPGIADADSKEIFNPFFQGSRTDKAVGGTGLGLSLCRQYIESIKGRVDLLSGNPKQTEFSISFPLILPS